MLRVGYRVVTVRMIDKTQFSNTTRHGLARVIARSGLCSRSQAIEWVRQGRVCVDGCRVTDPERRIATDLSQIEINGEPLPDVRRVYLAVNKPRGLVTTARDERGRATVYQVLDQSGLPWLAPVGRLDRASEGLLLMSNDSAWAAALLEPRRQVIKTYRVQVRGVPGQTAFTQMREGVVCSGEKLAVAEVSLLRSGGRTAWLDMQIMEGRNRHLRRLLEALNFPVLRLLRIAIGPLQLGDLPRGAWRHLTPNELRELDRSAGFSRSQKYVWPRRE